MKTKLCIGMVLLAAVFAQAQTNGLTSLLQQGLFEEQASRNLPAAISNYQALATQFDQDRQLAATAVFRIGECYRMEGRTNEAAAQYQRILSDFADQATLATLSRQNLTGMGFASSNAGNPSDQPNETSTEARSLAARIFGLEKLKSDAEEQARGVLAIFPDDVLEKMLTQLPKLQEQVDRLKANPQLTFREWFRQDEDFSAVGSDGKLTRGTFYGSGTNLDLLANGQRELNTQLSSIEQRVNFILGIQKARLKVLQSASGTEAKDDAVQNGMTSIVPDEESQEIQRIQQMIQNSPDLINAPSGSPLQRFTPLGRAASKGQLRVAKFLLANGASINATDDNGQTALNIAVEAGNRAMVEFLLSQGANVNAKSPGTEETPLHTAAKRGFAAVVKVLLANKVDLNAQNKVGWSPLMCAASANHPEIVKLLLAAGANPNLKGSNGETALNCAVGNSPEIFQALLAAGADPNTENSQGRTPLSYATEKDSSEIVKLLLAAKANPNGGKLDAPLLCAINKNDVASAELLLQAGANPNVNGNVDWPVNINGRFYSNHDITPLFFAISLKQFPMVQLLLKYKTDPNDSQFDGRPLLFSALSDTNILEALLEAGAKVDARDTTAKTGDNRILNWTPLLLAVENNFPAAAVEILLKRGANPNLRDGAFGQTSLHWIVGWGDNQLPNRKVLELLLDDKADPNVRNNSGKTPLDLFKMQLSAGNVSSEQKTAVAALADLLRQHGALDKLPDWDRITVSRPAANSSQTVFQQGTNDWNQFTLLETIFNSYPTSPGFRLINVDLPFPDLAHVTIVRPSHDSTNEMRIEVNLLNGTNGIDGAKDVPLQFGDVVEIPERDHALGDSPVGLTVSQQETIANCLRGTVQSVTHGQRVELPIYPNAYGSLLASVIQQSAAQNALLSSSDLSRVKVIRHNAQTGKEQEWMVDCSDQGSSVNGNSPIVYQWNVGGNNSSLATGLWLRDGDVIEVPEKP